MDKEKILKLSKKNIDIENLEKAKNILEDEYIISYGKYSQWELKKAIEENKSPVAIQDHLLIGYSGNRFIDVDNNSIPIDKDVNAIIIEDEIENIPNPEIEIGDSFAIVDKNEWDGSIIEFEETIGRLHVGPVFIPSHSAIFNFLKPTEKEIKGKIVSMLAGNNINIYNKEEYIYNAFHEIGHMMWRDCLTGEERESFKEYFKKLKPSAIYEYEWERKTPEEVFCTVYKWYMKSVLINKSFMNILKYEEPTGLTLLQTIFDRRAADKISEDTWELNKADIYSSLNPKYDVTTGTYFRKAEVFNKVKDIPLPRSILNNIDHYENDTEYIRLEKAIVPISKNKIDWEGMEKARQTKYIRRIPKAGGGWKYIYKEGEGKSSQKIDQTETPEFKKWFGDSKVVDGNGKPLVVYHGIGGSSELRSLNLSGKELQEYNKKRELIDLKRKQIWDKYKEKTEKIFEIPNYYNDPKLNQIVENAVNEREESEDKLEKLPKMEWFEDVGVKFEGYNFDVEKSQDIGVHFGTKEQANKFAGERGAIFPVYLRIENIKIVPDVFSRGGEYISMVDSLFAENVINKNYDKLIKLAEKCENIYNNLDDPRDFGSTELNKKLWNLVKRSLNKKIDGLKYQNEVEGSGWSYVVFEPTQIKSATGNRGTFDPNSADMTKAESPYFERSIIYMDIDGVVADFAGAYKDFFSRDAYKDDPFTVTQFVMTMPNFFRYLPVLEKGEELYNMLKDKYNIIFLTTPMDELEECRRDKLTWIKTNFPGHDIIFAKNKEEYVIDEDSVLIDDMKYNLSSWREAGGTAIDFKQKNNKILERINDIFDKKTKLEQVKEELNSLDIDDNPTEKEKESGQYKKGKINIKNLDIMIENIPGSIRFGNGFDGKRWLTKVRDFYGYIKGTEGTDLDPIDIFINPKGVNRSLVFVINQNKPDGMFDEIKCMLGYDDEESARKAYLRNYEKGWEKNIHSIVRTNTKRLRDYIKTGNKLEPFTGIENV